MVNKEYEFRKENPVYDDTHLRVNSDLADLKQNIIKHIRFNSAETRKRERKETAKPYLDFIKWIEEKLDDKNGELGEEDKYCLYCESGSYDEKGIIHAPCCLITEIRKFLSVGSLDQHTKKKVHGVKE